jgi:hypothetical protein
MLVSEEFLPRPHTPRIGIWQTLYSKRLYLYNILRNHHLKLGTWVSVWNSAAFLMHTRIYSVALHCVEALFTCEGLKISETPGSGIVKI